MKLKQVDAAIGMRWVRRIVRSLMIGVMCISLFCLVLGAFEIFEAWFDPVETFESDGKTLVFVLIGIVGPILSCIALNYGKPRRNRSRTVVTG